MSTKRSRAAFIGTAALAAGPRTAKAAQFEFKVGTENPVDHPNTTRLNQMCAAIEQESGGRVRIQQFPNSQLGNGPAMLSQVRLGALDFMQVSAFVLGSVVPPAGIASLGFAFKDADEAIRVMSGGAISDYIHREALSKGFQTFRTMWSGGMFQLTTGAVPIKTPADMRGLKIRVQPSKIVVDLFKELGASPTSLSASEVYTALQTRVVDGNANALGGIEGYKLYEVQKYVSMTNHGWAGLWLIVNADTWQKLPSDLRDVIERNNTKFAAAEHAEMKAADQAVAGRLAQQGMAINQVDQAAFVAALRNYYKQWADAFGAAEWQMLQRSLGRNLA